MNLVVKHNYLIEAEYSMNLFDLRLFNYLISLIHIDDTELKLNSIKITKLIAKLKLSKSNVPYFRNQLECFTHKFIKIKGIEDKKIITVNPLDKRFIKINKYEVTIKLNDDLKPYLINLKKNFTSIEFEKIIKLNSIYGIRIYEMICQFSNIGNRKMNIQDLKSILCLKNSYSQYSNIKSKVLNKAISDIKKNLKVKVNFCEILEWKKVIAVNFKFKELKQINNAETSNETDIDTFFRNDDVLSSMIAIGYPEKLAKKRILKYGEDYCNEKLDITNSGNRKNAVGFMEKALKDNYLKNKEIRELTEADRRYYEQNKEELENWLL